MQPFEGFIGNTQVIRMLASLADHPGHAYLFHGPDGIGKRVAAHAFAARMLGLSRVEELAAHPDFIALEREEGSRELKIKQTREFVARLNMTSAKGGYKIALVTEADRLNEESANALLKSVEEPSGQTVFIFVTEQPYRLPATLRSRLASVAFLPAAATELGRYSEEIRRASRGCPGIAERIMSDPDAWRSRRKEASRFADALVNGSLGKELGEIERLAKRLQSEEDTELAWKAFISELMQVLPEKLGHDPVRFSQFGRGLARAWNMVGSSLSPHLALEWAAVEPYIIGKRPLPELLHPRYL